MSAPSTTALAALLASHPEECAAVVALLVSEGSTEGTGPWSCESIAIEVDVPLFLTRSIVMVLCAVGIVQERGDGCTAPLKADRRAIARMGAASWLAGRVGAPLDASPREREFRSSARLFAIAAEVWASPIPEPRKTDVRWFVRSALPESARRYRDALEDLAAMGERAIDVDAEVAAVWGAGAPAKGERR